MRLGTGHRARPWLRCARPTPLCLGRVRVVRQDGHADTKHHDVPQMLHHKPRIARRRPYLRSGGPALPFFQALRRVPARFLECILGGGVGAMRQVVCDCERWSRCRTYVVQGRVSQRQTRQRCCTALHAQDASRRCTALHCMQGFTEVERMNAKRERGEVRRRHICSGTRIAAARSPLGLDSPHVTSAPGLGSPLPLPHLHRDLARPVPHRDLAHPMPHLHRDLAHPMPHLHRDWACRF